MLRPKPTNQFHNLAGFDQFLKHLQRRKLIGEIMVIAGAMGEWESLNDELNPLLIVYTQEICYILLR